MTTDDAAPGLPATLPVQAPAQADGRGGPAADPVAVPGRAPGVRLRTVLLLGLPGLLALAAAVLLWQRLEHVQAQLALQLAHSSEAAQAARAQAEAARELAQQLGRESASRIPELQAKVAELQLQGAQMGVRMEELLRRNEPPSGNQGLATDLEPVLNLAWQYAQASGNVQFLIATLQNARMRVEQSGTPQLQPVLLALEQDLQQLFGLHVPDMAGLTARLQRMEALVERLRLPSVFASPDEANAGPAPQDATPPPPATQDPPEPQDAAQGSSSWQHWPWWRARGARLWQWGERGWAQVGGQMRDLVRLRRLDAPQTLLLAPEHGALLRDNLRRQLQAARMALLARQWEAARTDLLRAADMLAAAPFAADLHTRLLAEQLQGMLGVLHPPGAPDIQRSLAALAAAAAATTPRQE